MPILHPRHAQVARARNEIGLAVIAAWQGNDLTAGELVSVLASLTSEHTKYVLRNERHPLEPDKKADEA